MGSVWAWGLELVMLRMAFFCMMNIYSIQCSILMRNWRWVGSIGCVSGIVNGTWFSGFSEEESSLLGWYRIRPLRVLISGSQCGGGRWGVLLEGFLVTCMNVRMDQYGYYGHALVRRQGLSQMVKRGRYYQILFSCLLDQLFFHGCEKLWILFCNVMWRRLRSTALKDWKLAWTSIKA